MLLWGQGAWPVRAGQWLGTAWVPLVCSALTSRLAPRHELWNVVLSAAEELQKALLGWLLVCWGTSVFTPGVCVRRSGWWRVSLGLTAGQSAAAGPWHSSCRRLSCCSNCPLCGNQRDS